MTVDAEGLYPKTIMLYIAGSEGQLIILVDYGNENIGFFIMKAAPDDLSQYLPLAWGIVDTVQFQEPESD